MRPWRLKLLVILLLGATGCSDSGDQGECTDLDGDGYGLGSACQGSDCDDQDDTCHQGDCCLPVCNDADGDGYGEGPGCAGSDCNDQDPECQQGDCCEPEPDCLDSDGDGYGSGADCLGSDCDDQDPGCFEGDCCPSFGCIGPPFEPPLTCPGSWCGEKNTVCCPQGQACLDGVCAALPDAPCTDENAFFVAQNHPAGCDDDHPGTGDEPWCSIQKAANTLQAGETVCIKEGVYFEEVQPLYSGAADSYITYRGFPGDEVIIDGQRDDAQDWRPSAVLIFQKSYLRLIDLKLTNAVESALKVVGPADHLVFEGLTITDNGVLDQDGNLIPWVGTGIELRGYDDNYNTILVEKVLIRNCDIHRHTYDAIWVRHAADLWIEHSHVSYSSAHNIEVYQLYAMPDRQVIISDNESHHAAIQGMNMKPGHYVLIRGNHTHHNGATGIQLHETSGTAIWPTHLVIECNLSEDNAQTYPGETGIWSYYSDHVVIQNNVVRGNENGIFSGYHGSQVIIRNNLVLHNNKPTGNRGRGLKVLTGSVDTIAVHNTFFQNGHAENDGATVAMGLNGAHTGTVTKNNIVSESLSMFDLWVANGECESDTNNYYNTRDLQIVFGTSLLDFDSYVAQSGWDQNSITSDPQFQDPQANDFKPIPASPAVDSGGPLTQTTASGSGDQVTVDDARYFTDGYGLVPGDLVTIGQNPPARIVAVDYATHTLTLEDDLTWEQGDPVSYPFSGSAPDMGAYEL